MKLLANQIFLGWAALKSQKPLGGCSQQSWGARTEHQSFYFHWAEINHQFSASGNLFHPLQGTFECLEMFLLL